jgi:hypothetical protein
MLGRAAAGFFAVLALALAGCGGSETVASSKPSEGAKFAPSSAPAYIELSTDVDGDQWKKADAVLDRFPGKQKLLDQILTEIQKEGLSWDNDIRPALGDALSVVWLDFENGGDNLVGFTKPENEAKFEHLLETGDDPAVHRKVDGWTVFAENDALLDRFEQARAGGSLADQELFSDTIAELPGDALAKAYVSGRAVGDALRDLGPEAQLGGLGDLDSLAAAVTAEDEGARLAGLFKGKKLADRAQTYTPELLDHVPSGAYAVLSFKGGDEFLKELRDNPTVQTELPEVERALGVTLDELLKLFTDEVALYVRPGAPFPEVTLLLATEDKDGALRTIDQLARRVATMAGGRFGSDRVDDVDLRYVEIQGFRISYGVVDDMVVVTSGRHAIRELKSDGDKIADDEDFRRAKEAAGLEDETSGFLYANLGELVPLIQMFAGLSEEGLSPQVSDNLEPLDSLVIHASPDGDAVEFTAFLGVR